MHAPFLSPQKQQKYLQLLDRRAQAWPGPTQERVVETASAHTFVRLNGAADAPPLVLLPGGGTNSLMWTRTIGGLSSAFRTYALDNPIDVGRSRELRPFTTVDDLVGWLDEVLDALGVKEPVNLMGMSYGGWLAANYAQRRPARLRRLVLVAPAAWLAPLQLSMVFRMLLTFLPPRRYWIRRTYVHTAPDLAAADPAAIEAMAEELDTAIECFGLKRMSKLVPPTVATDEELASLQVPTLFVVGERETIYDPRVVLARLTRVAPSIAQAVISGVGHDLPWLASAELAARATAFLR
ncbi:MAG: alpha/beta fold hydrolase [Myxococcota bacterium]